MQFFQTKNHSTIVHEFQRMSRIIPLDGRPFRTGYRAHCTTAIRWGIGKATMLVDCQTPTLSAGRWTIITTPIP